MTRSYFWIAIALTCIVPATSRAHRISFSGELWCPDLTNNGVVDLEDVAVLLVHHGLCPEAEGACRGDFNHNGYVAEGDLEIILANLGPCPVKGDANGDGTVDIADMVTIGADTDLDCHADFDHDGRVGGRDVAIAEAAWGPGLDSHPRVPTVDGNETLSPVDLQMVFDAIGRNCRSDINHDGHVDSDDVDLACELTGLCPSEP